MLNQRFWIGLLAAIVMGLFIGPAFGSEGEDEEAVDEVCMEACFDAEADCIEACGEADDQCAAECADASEECAEEC